MAYSLAVGLGINAVLTFIIARLPNSRLGMNATITVAICCTLIYEARRIKAEAVPYRFSTDYIAVSRWLKGNSDSSDWVACDEIGYIGAYSQRNIRDMLGLIEGPRSIPPLTAHRWDWWLTDEPEPRFIVLHQVRWPGEPGDAHMEWPEKSLALFARDYAPVYRSGQIEVYQHH